MNFSVILWWLGIALLVVGAASLGPIFAALLAGESRILSAHGLSLMVCVFLGTTLLIISSVRREAGYTKSGIREIVLLLIVLWILVPIPAGMPLLLTGYSLVDAWYETVSAMTTTGAWLSWEVATSSSSAMIWRAELQWLGGLVSLSAAAAVFVRPQFIGIASVSTPFSRGEEESYLRAFRTALINFLPFYAAITIFVAVLFILFSVPANEALVMAFSLAASGGFIPAGDAVDAYVIPFQLICFVTMILSAISFVTVVNALRLTGQKIRIKQDFETPVFLICIVLVGVLFVLTSEEKSLGNLPGQILNATSVLSTNGFLFSETPGLTPVLVTAVIGGAAISTAGGLKLIRWIVTFRRAGHEIWKLIHPSGVSGSDGAVNELAVWIHYIAFTIFLACLVLIISMFGHSLELSVTAAVASISNAGPVLAAASESADYQIFNPVLRVILALGMIIGRLEMVVALALFNNFFWRS